MMSPNQTPLNSLVWQARELEVPVLKEYPTTGSYRRTTRTHAEAMITASSPLTHTIHQAYHTSGNFAIFYMSLCTSQIQ